VAAKQANPGYLQARVMLGVLMLSAGELEQAIGEFRAVLELDPNNRNAQTYLRIANIRKESAPPATSGQS
jgi:Tfp pilus assembly protein PilF